MFATTSSFSDVVLFLLIVVPLAMFGFRKMFRQFDKDGKMHDAAHKGIVGVIEGWFKK